MNQNKIILDNWWQDFKNYPRLNINEAKLLYKEYQKTKEQKTLETIFNGTMYLIYNQIKNNYYLNYNSIDFNIEDILMNSIEIWFRFLKNGEILNIQIFSDFFKKNFHYKLINMTLKSSLINISTVNLYDIGCRKMANLFFMYIHGLNIENISTPLEDVFKKLIVVANNININLKLVPSRKIEFILKPLINIMIRENLDSNIIVNDEYEKIINKICYEQIDNIIKPEDRNIRILKSYYGFYSNKSKTTNDLAEEYNCTRQNIEQIINRELKKIRKQIK